MRSFNLSSFTIRRSFSYLILRALHTLYFDSRFEGPDKGNVYWMVLDEEGDPAGYCSARPEDENTVFLSRAAVMRRARGNGLHRRLIRVRLRWAKRQGFSRAYTYTRVSNIPTQRNLIREGFLPIGLEDEWLEFEKWL